jgi:hypothetical protein
MTKIQKMPLRETKYLESEGQLELLTLEEIPKEIKDKEQYLSHQAMQLGASHIGYSKEKIGYYKKPGRRNSTYRPH